MSMHIAEVLGFWARRCPDRLAVRFPDRDLTWSELDRSVDELAAGLYDDGLRPGDVVGILMSNRPQFLESLLAAFRVGAVVELLNVRFTAAEMVHPIVDAGTVLVVTEEALLPALADALQKVPDLKVVTADRTEGYRALDNLRVPGGTPPARHADAEEIALLAYTSGTTGTPKGAMLPHRAIIANGTARATADGITSADRVLITIPMAYTGGIGTYLRESLLTGATAVIEATFEPERLLELLQTERITVCSSVPVIFEKILALPEFATADLSSLRACTGAGAVMPLEVIRAWQARGVGMRQGYGQTECGGGYATILYEDEAESRLGSAGRPIMHHEIRIVDALGDDVPAGTSGEILLRGPSIMAGYWNNPTATEATLAGGWLHTGDIGVLDDEGYLRVVDRAKDMLISGGLNVYPAEIEAAIVGLPGLEECAVVGVPDEKWGEVPMLVVPSTDDLDLEGLKGELRRRLADYRRPKWIVANGEPLPRTMSGKILKREIRSTFPEVPETALPMK